MSSPRVRSGDFVVEHLGCVCDHDAATHGFADFHVVVTDAIAGYDFEIGKTFEQGSVGSTVARAGGKPADLRPDLLQIGIWICLLPIADAT